MTFGTITLPQRLVLLLRLPLELGEKLGFWDRREQGCWAEDTAASRPVEPKLLGRPLRGPRLRDGSTIALPLPRHFPFTEFERQKAACYLPRGSSLPSIS